MNIKNEQGITMLALVITIVVMVILASIAISSSVGDNGLIKQTEEGIIHASIREVEEALDAYLLLNEKELIKSGDLSTNVTLLTESIKNELLSNDAKTTIATKYNVDNSSNNYVNASDVATLQRAVDENSSNTELYDLNADDNVDDSDVTELKQQYYEYYITPNGLKKLGIKGKYGKENTTDVFVAKQYATEEIEVYYIDQEGTTY